MEEDWQRGQSYTAHWHSVNLVPHLHRLTMTEAERSGKYCEARRLLQRFLSGAISQRLPESKMHLPRRPHHQPAAAPFVIGSKMQPVHIQKEVCCVTMSPKSVMLETNERKTMVKMTKLQRFLG
ncbi:uncharacterized protein LOC119009991 isoform X2 [Scomber scombrus]|uniref:Uncharacterized protein LOC119009991 isoform X2 n=1 Tax=Scomber scombrus TaxID=13677 RepID=A0AAV1NE46_SCOSC